jgi:hypothetical protein
MDNPLSGTDIKNIFNNKIKVILYSDINKYNNIYELLHPYNKVVILYVHKIKEDGGFFGHWQCVFKNKNNNIEIFDSFGSWIDSFLDTIPMQFRKQHKQSYKILSELLLKSKNKIEYNDKQLQNKETNTCGKWCSYRILRNDLTIEEFQNLFSDDTLKNDKYIINLFSN